MTGSNKEAKVNFLKFYYHLHKSQNITKDQTGMVKVYLQILYKCGAVGATVVPSSFKTKYM